MERKIVFDASVVLAILNQEEGFKVAQKYLSDAVISSVNFSEVLTVANRKVFKTKEETEEGVKLIQNVFPHVIGFDQDQAIIASSLDQRTKEYGLSLGDRACLALAKKKGYSVLTADKIWKELDLDVDIKLIR